MAAVTALATVSISLGSRAAAREVGAIRPALVPAPRVLTLAPGSARLAPGWSIVVEDSAEDSTAAELVSREISERLGWTPSPARDTAAARAIVLLHSPWRAPAFPLQAYRLTIRPGRIVIRGLGPQGRFYGVQTLRQLIRTSSDGRLPCLDILDWPSMPWRGVSDDVSHGPMPTARDLRERMARLAYYKIDLYSIDLEDVPTPRSDSTRGITAAELTQLTIEARRNHIRVLPINPDRRAAIADTGRTDASIRSFRAAGFPDVFVSRGLWNRDEWYPNDARGLANVQALVDQARAARSAGAIISAWGDQGSTSLRLNNRLGYAYGAAAAWQEESPPIAAFFDDFAHVEYGADGTELGTASRLVAFRDARELDDLARALQRLPHVRRCGASWRAEMVTLQADMVMALSLIDRAAPGVRHDAADHVRALRLAAEQYRHLAERELAMDQIADSLQDSGPDARERTARRLRRLREQARELMRDYVELGLTRNQADHVDDHLATLDREARELGMMAAAAQAGRLSVWTPGQPSYSGTRWEAGTDRDSEGLTAFVSELFTGKGLALSVSPPATEPVEFETNRWDLYPRHQDLCISTFTQMRDRPGVVVSLQNEVQGFAYYRYTIQRDSRPPGPPHDSRAGSIAVDFDSTGSQPEHAVIRVQAVSSRGRPTPPCSFELAFYPSALYVEGGRAAPNWLVLQNSDLGLCGSSVEDWIVDRPSAEDREYARKRWGPMVAPLRTDYEKAQAIACDLARTLHPHEGIPSPAMAWVTPLEQLARAESGADHIWCADYADIFGWACNALDIPVRKINMQYLWSSAGRTNFQIGEGHRTTEVFDRDTNHWIWIDVTLGILGARMDNQDPVNLVDLVRIVNDERKRRQLHVLEYDVASGTETSVPVLESRRWRDLLTFFRKDQHYEYMRRAPTPGS